MCEENAVEKLMTFNFAGFTHEAEDALSFKARNADPLVRPFYSRILHTWYVRRGDYRNGTLLLPDQLPDANFSAAMLFFGSGAHNVSARAKACCLVEAVGRLR